MVRIFVSSCTVYTVHVEYKTLLHINCAEPQVSPAKWTRTWHSDHVLRLMSRINST